MKSPAALTGGGAAVARVARKVAVYSAPGVAFTLGAGTGFISALGRGIYLNTTLSHMGVLKAADDLFIKKWANAI